MTARRSSSSSGAPLSGLAATHVAGRRTRSPRPRSCGPSGRSRPPCRPSLPPGRRPAGPACQTRPATPRGLRSWATGGWGWLGGSSRSRLAVLRTPHQHWASTHHRPLRPRVGLLGWAGTPCGVPSGGPVPGVDPCLTLRRGCTGFDITGVSGGILSASLWSPSERRLGRPASPRSHRSLATGGWGWLGGSSRTRLAVLRTPHRH